MHRARANIPPPPHRRHIGMSVGAILVTALARPGDTLTMDNQVAVLCGAIDPMTECAGIDLRQQLIKHLVARPITFRWVPSHQHLSEAKDEDETVGRNNEADKWAKKKKQQPSHCPRVNQQTPHIVICGDLQKIGLCSAAAFSVSYKHTGSVGYP